MSRVPPHIERDAQESWRRSLCKASGKSCRCTHCAYKRAAALRHKAPCALLIDPDDPVQRTAAERAHRIYEHVVNAEKERIIYAIFEEQMEWR